MGEGRSFPTVVVVSVVTGRLLCPIGDLYDVLSHLVGRPVFTHEIPEACPVAQEFARLRAASPNPKEAPDAAT